MKGIYKGTELIALGGLICAFYIDVQPVRLIGVLVVAVGSYRLAQLNKY